MPRPKVQRNEIKYKFSKHDIVWAKTAGYRWWPAAITSLPSKSRCFYKVDFIGDRSYALLSQQELAPYLDYCDQYQHNKKNDKHFTNAVTIAARKYQQLIVKQTSSIKSKVSNECKTSQLKQQLNEQNQLPQIPENIQQLSSLNQQLILPQSQQAQNHPTFSNIPNDHLQEEPQSYQKTHERSPTQLLKASDQLQEEPLSLEPQNKQKFMEQLLIKYKLNALPDFKDLKKTDKQSSANNKKGPHYKKKLIMKARQSSAEQRDEQLSDDALLTRKIYRFLLRKLHSSSQSQDISLSLKDQIVLQKSQKITCLRKVIQWIQMTESQNIFRYHREWINFYKQSEREKQKHSNLTMEEESQQVLVK